MTFDEWCEKHGVYLNDPDDGSKAARLMARKAWEAGAAEERERICDAIKAEDDHCADRDYMLDSDDCIAVARGQWKRPE